jgi:hypothetical protein
MMPGSPQDEPTTVRERGQETGSKRQTRRGVQRRGDQFRGRMWTREEAKSRRPDKFCNPFRVGDFFRSTQGSRSALALFPAATLG